MATHVVILVMIGMIMIMIMISKNQILQINSGNPAIESIIKQTKTRDREIPSTRKLKSKTNVNMKRLTLNQFDPKDVEKLDPRHFAGEAEVCPLFNRQGRTLYPPGVAWVVHQGGCKWNWKSFIGWMDEFLWNISY